MLYSKTTGGFYNREIHGDSIPADAVEITVEQYTTLLAGQSEGKVIVADSNGNPSLADQSEQTIDIVISKYTNCVQQQLDSFARTHNYDGILSACTYSTSSVPKFKAEGQYAVEARDATWAKCYEIMGDVKSGNREMPTIDELIAELPVLKWPNS